MSIEDKAKTLRDWIREAEMFVGNWNKYDDKLLPLEDAQKLEIARASWEKETHVAIDGRQILEAKIADALNVIRSELWDITDKDAIWKVKKILNTDSPVIDKKSEEQI
jgi:hypothetical protein